MKKKLLFALSLALIAVMTFSAGAFAWDVEDPLVVANEDFIAGGGVDGPLWETQSGAQPWPYGKNPNEGYNLYRDDITNTGNLDQVFILTFTPDEVDLPVITSYGPYPGLDEYWYMGDESPDTWYWATAPRGVFLMHSPLPDWGCPAQFYLRVGGAASSQNYHWADGSAGGTTIRDDISQIGAINGTQYRIEIEAGTVITNYGSRSSGYLLFSMVEGEPYFEQKNLEFSKPVVLSERVNGEWGVWTETLTFTNVSGGRAS